MKKVLSSLVVLAILVGMFVCLGAQAFAEEEKDIAVFAVTDAQLDVDMIGLLKEQTAGALIIDVDGLAEGQSDAGYDIVWRAEDPMVMALAGPTYVWPGFAQTYEVGLNQQKILLVGVGADTEADVIAAAISDADPDGTAFRIAVGPAAAAEAVKNQVKVFLAAGETDGAISDLENTKVIHVGQIDAPVAALSIDKEGNVAKAENVAVPAAAVQTTEEPGATEEPVALYDVIYSGNGGTGAVQDDYDFQSDLDYYFRQNGYTAPEGQEFAGWMIEGDETGTLYQPNDLYHLDRDIKVLAQWKQIATAEPSADGPSTGATGELGLGVGPVASVVKIYFAAGEGTGSMDAQDAALNFDYELPDNGFEAPAGKHFDHWQGADYLDYYPGDLYRVTGETTFTALWEDDVVSIPESTSYTVTYQPGLAAGSCQEVKNTYAQGTQIGLSKPEGWSFEGYVLTGWTKEGVSYSVDELFEVNGDASFEAVWSPESTIVNAVVTYEAGDHATGEPVTEQKMDIGAGVDYGVLPDCPFVPEEGYAFVGWAVKGDDSGKIYLPSVSDPSAGQYHLIGDVTFVAQWQQASSEPESYTVSFAAGSEVYEGTMNAVTVKQGEKLLLPDCGFTVPGMSFDGWDVGAELPVPAGTEIEVTASMEVKATWKPAEVTYTVTYKAGEAASDINKDINVDGVSAGAYTLLGSPFQAPEGKQFSHWDLGGSQYNPNDVYTVSGNVEFTAIWKDAPADNQTPVMENGNETQIQWVRGNTNKPTVTFANAEIATVSVNGLQLTEDVQVNVEGKTLELEPAYLNTLNEGDYNMAVSFKQDENGGTFNDYIMRIAVTVPPQTTDAIQNANMTWDRSRSDWYHDFGHPISGLYIYYGNGTYQQANINTDYYLANNNHTLYMKMAMVNGNWGGVWPSARYNFKVTFSDGTAEQVFTVEITGNGVAQNVQTPVPTNANGVPVTGDDTPITMYIVILAVLIVVLAVVLIIVMKRRSGKGRH